MTDDLVGIEMRLAAIEYLLCQLWVNSMKFGGVTEQEFAWRTDAMLANIHKQTLPRFERLSAAKLREAVARLVGMQREMLGFQKLPRHGQNKPIGPSELEQAIGPEVLATLSHQTGLPREEIVSRLSRNLPDAVDKYTPEGRLPSENDLRGAYR